MLFLVLLLLIFFPILLFIIILSLMRGPLVNSSALVLCLLHFPRPEPVRLLPTSTKLPALARFAGIANPPRRIPPLIPVTNYLFCDHPLSEFIFFSRSDHKQLSKQGIRLRFPQETSPILRIRSFTT